jgi:predicted transcriptional regulator
MKTLTDKNVRTIRNRYNKGNVTQTQLADTYKVSQAHISRIVNYTRRASVSN